MNWAYKLHLQEKENMQSLTIKIIIILMVQLDFAIKSNYNTKLTLTDICDPIYQLK